ncbi:hypothetical protein ACNKHP_17865 [Shigella boydii]
MTVAKVQIRKHQIALGLFRLKKEIVFGVNVVGQDGAEGKQNNHEGKKRAPQQPISTRIAFWIS